MKRGRAARRARFHVSRRFFAIVALGGVNLGVLGTDIYLLSQRNVTRPVTFGSALARFHAAKAAAAAAPTLTGATPTSQAGATGATAPTGAAGPTSQPSSAGPTTPLRVAARATQPHAAGAPPTTTAAPPFGIPAEGVYAYKTSGGEQVNILDASHSYPSVTYATVRHDAGCNWLIENDVVQEHTDRRELCSAPGKFFEVSQSRYITFFGKTDGGTYTCNPQIEMIAVGDPAGVARDGVCSDAQGNGARLHVVDLGTEQVTVGGVAVTVVHTTVDGQLTGKAVGTSHDDLLLLAGNGMTVSWTRSVDSIADAAFGAKAHYTEHASFYLMSLTPQT